MKNIKFLGLCALVSLLTSMTYADNSLGESCYWVSGGFSSQMLRRLGLNQQPLQICTYRNVVNNRETIVLRDEAIPGSRSCLGYFEAELTGQARCLDCIDRFYQTYIFHNMKALNGSGLVKMQVRFTGSYTTIRNTLKNGKIIFNDSVFNIDAYQDR